MEMRNFRPELHVAQQSRRDKLRVPQSSSPAPQLEDFPDHLEQLVVHQRLNPDLVQVRSVSSANLLYDPAAYSSEIINFSTKSNVLSAERDGMMRQEVDATQIARHIVGEDSPFANSSLQVSPNINSLSKAPIEPQNCGNWKGFGSHQSFDWMMSHASGSVGDESNISSPMFLGEVSNISAYPQFLKPGSIGFQDVRSLKNHSCEISSEDRQKRSREMHFTPSSLYQNTFQDVFASASIRTQGLEMVSHVQQNFRGAGRGAWADGGNELGLLPAYGNQSDVICFDNGSAWTNRPVESCHQWNGELGCVDGKSGENLRNDACDSNPQGLSLSLSSSKPTLKVPAVQFGDRCGTEDLQSRTTALNDPQDSKSTKSGYLSSVGKPSTISRCGKSLQDMVGVSTNTYRSTGPLGPFTGYATILKSSKFLKPTQQLLDECCGVSGSKVGKTCEVSERRSGEVSALGDTTNEIETEAGVIGNNSGASSSTFYSSNEMSCDGGAGSSSSESFRPEFQQRKAKLLYMQEEVCRRYKQYHQQMQMVVSSFESVAGLSSATPYISLALKSVSRHFRFLKNAISDQLKHIGRALGEDLSSPTTGISSSKGDTNLPRLKHLEQSLPRQRYGAGNVSFFETQQPVWRPQRGLPERSVAILRAWLFEHFLHPYPTDTDKHMLATQTGLSRNQVSNWFINARVRVWKPMVEEIHMLETKGVAGGNPSSNRNDEGSTAEGNGHPGGEQLSHNLSINMMPNKRLERTELGSPGSIGHGIGAEQWDQEKRSRMDCQIPAGMDGSLMGFVPYQRRGLEMGGLGAVSLTLGLRHGAENVQHQQQEDQLRQQFGGRMIHDFVG